MKMSVYGLFQLHGLMVIIAFFFWFRKRGEKGRISNFRKNWRNRETTEWKRGSFGNKDINARLRYSSLFMLCESCTGV